MGLKPHNRDTYELKQRYKLQISLSHCISLYENNNEVKKSMQQNQEFVVNLMACNFSHLTFHVFLPSLQCGTVNKTSPMELQ